MGRVPALGKARRLVEAGGDRADALRDGQLVGTALRVEAARSMEFGPGVEQRAGNRHVVRAIEQTEESCPLAMADVGGVMDVGEHPADRLPSLVRNQQLPLTPPGLPERILVGQRARKIRA